MKVFGCRPHEGGAARTGADVRKPPREMLWGGGEDIASIVADVNRWKPREVGRGGASDAMGISVLHRSVDRLFGKRSMGRRVCFVDRGRQNQRRAAELRCGTAKQHQRARQPAAVDPSLEDIDRG